MERRQPRRASRRPARSPARTSVDRSLRPRTLDDFVGQEAVRDQLAVVTRGGRGDAARRSTTSCSPDRRASARPRSRRSSPSELDAPFVMTAGPALERKGDIAALLTALEPRAVFFVDEIHRLNRALEETLLPGDGGPRACRSRSARAPGRAS